MKSRGIFRSVLVAMIVLVAVLLPPAVATALTFEKPFEYALVHAQPGFRNGPLQVVGFLGYFGADPYSILAWPIIVTQDLARNGASDVALSHDIDDDFPSYVSSFDGVFPKWTFVAFNGVPGIEALGNSFAPLEYKHYVGLGGVPCSLAANPSGPAETVWASLCDRGEVVKVNVEQDRVVARYNVGPELAGNIAVSPDGRCLYAIRKALSLPTQGGPSRNIKNGVGRDYRGGYKYELQALHAYPDYIDQDSVDADQYNIWFKDRACQHYGEKLKLGDNPTSVTVSGDSRVVLVTDRGSNQVSVFASNASLANAPLRKLMTLPSGGRRPVDVAVTPDQRRVLVVNAGNPGDDYTSHKGTSRLSMLSDNARSTAAIYNVRTQSLVDTVELQGVVGRSIELSPDGKSALVTMANGVAKLKIDRDPVQQKFIATVPIGDIDVGSSPAATARVPLGPVDNQDYTHNPDGTYNPGAQSGDTYSPATSGQSTEVQREGHQVQFTFNPFSISKNNILFPSSASEKSGVRITP